MKRGGDVFVGSTHKSKQGCSFTVLKYNNYKDVVVEFNDSHKHQASFKSQHIKSGNVKNPFHKSVYGKGFIGSGNYNSQVNPKEYRKWKSMLERCYCPKRLELQPSYADCRVSDDWHNFQNFAKWMSKKPEHQKDFDLDKDLFGGNSKLYSAENCTLLPREINSAIVVSKYDVNNLITFVKKDGYKLRVDRNGVNQIVGRFPNKDEAVRAYGLHREGVVKGLAKKWRGSICEASYQALMAWKI